MRSAGAEQGGGCGEERGPHFLEKRSCAPGEQGVFVRDGDRCAKNAVRNSASFGADANPCAFDVAGGGGGFNDGLDGSATFTGRDRLEPRKTRWNYWGIGLQFC